MKKTDIEKIEEIRDFLVGMNEGLKDKRSKMDGSIQIVGVAEVEAEQLGLCTAIALINSSFSELP